MLGHCQETMSSGLRLFTGKIDLYFVPRYKRDCGVIENLHLAADGCPLFVVN